MEFDFRLGLDGAVSVTLSAFHEWRERPDVTGGPFAESSALLADFVFSWAPSMLQLQLTDLPAGFYRMTTYHHDTEFSGHGSLAISVSDATGTIVVISGLAQSWGTSPANISAPQFGLVADGTHPVTIRLDVVAGSGNAAILNGFDLIALEPPILAESVSWSAVRRSTPPSSDQGADTAQVPSVC